MNLTQDRKWTTLLFNPFVYIAGAQALGLGLAAIVIASLICLAGHTHFDGVLDTHAGGRAPFGLFFAEGLVDWLCLAIMLLIFGKLVSKTAFRTIDLFGTQALARWPSLFIGLLTLPPAFQRFNHELLALVSTPGLTPAILTGKLQAMPTFTIDAAVFFIAAIFMLPLVCWMVALMYQSYSVSCNIRGAKAVVTFILGLLLAEIVSKIVIYRLLF